MMTKRGGSGRGLLPTAHDDAYDNSKARRPTWTSCLGKAFGCFLLLPLCYIYIAMNAGSDMTPEQARSYFSDTMHSLEPPEDARDCFCRLHESQKTEVMPGAKHHPDGRQEPIPWVGEASIEDLKDLCARVQHINELAAKARRDAKVRLVGATTTNAELDEVQGHILRWIAYHTAMGMTDFFLFYDGDDQDALMVLRMLSHVTIEVINKDIANGHVRQVMEVFSHMNKYYEDMSKKGGNYQLMFKQSFAMTAAIEIARNRGIDWLFHFDTDEVWVPAPQFVDGGFQAYLTDPERVPVGTSDISFSNLEAQPEGDEVSDEFDEVTLFKVNTGRFHAYIQGKAMGRISAPNLQPHGPHMFFTTEPARKHDKLTREADKDTGVDAEYRPVNERSVVLHYTHCKVSDIAAKAKRTCHVSIDPATGKRSEEDIKRCADQKNFLLKFDREAYSIAMTEDQDRIRAWFNEHVVGEVKDPKAAASWVETGAARRITSPQQVFKRHAEEATAHREKHFGPRRESGAAGFFDHCDSAGAGIRTTRPAESG